tara:strand:+ start:71 stop:967 length:897 start_codon:yes stop_codon:yes gene_type:complete
MADLKEREYYPVMPIKHESPLSKNIRKSPDFGKPDRHAWMSYRDYIGGRTGFYDGVPGGADRVISDAKKARKRLGNEFNTIDSVAIAPALDDWTLNRKNPAMEYNMGATRTGGGPQKDGRRTGGLAFPQGLIDKKGRSFSPAYTFNANRALNLNEQRMAYNPMSEEMVHGAQPRVMGKKDTGNYFGLPNKELPYAAHPMELGAKLTNMKQRYAQQIWGQSANPPNRGFNRDDARKILQKYYDKINADAGMKDLRRMKGGLKYIKDNEEELLDFLEATASNERREPQIPGMNTGPNRYA